MRHELLMYARPSPVRINKEIFVCADFVADFNRDSIFKRISNLFFFFFFILDKNIAIKETRDNTLVTIMKNNSLIVTLSPILIRIRSTNLESFLLLLLYIKTL